MAAETPGRQSSSLHSHIDSLTATGGEDDIIVGGEMEEIEEFLFRLEEEAGERAAGGVTGDGVTEVGDEGGGLGVNDQREGW